MKAKDWQSAAKLIRERQNQAATADSGELSSFPLSELSVNESGPPTVLQGPYVPLSTSTPIHVPQGNQQTMDSTPEESLFQQVIPNIPQQSLYPSLAALETSVNMAVSSPIPFMKRVINDIEEHAYLYWIENLYVHKTKDYDTTQVKRKHGRLLKQKTEQNETQKPAVNTYTT